MPATSARLLNRLAAWISDLRLAIALLLVIAITSGIGTVIPQREPEGLYHQLYDQTPWLGLLKGDAVLSLQLDHIYSSGWFLGLLGWLALSLLLCSWRRQWPALQAALRWIDYRSPRQLSKLSLAETVTCDDADASLQALEQRLRLEGWQIRPEQHRLAARKGVPGRVGPLLVHAGLVVLMLGAAWGVLGGRRAEQFLAPGRSLELMDSRGHSELTLALDSFVVERDPAGRPEQFRSSLRILDGDGGDTSNLLQQAEISVNHPLRFRGVTLYQADWGLAAISVQLGRSPVLQLPLQTFPQLGEQVWGLVLPTRPDGSDPVLLSLGSEQGPVDVYGADGTLVASLAVAGPAQEVNDLPIRVISVLPASGIRACPWCMRASPSPLWEVASACWPPGSCGPSLSPAGCMWPPSATATSRRWPGNCRSCWRSCPNRLRPPEPPTSAGLAHPVAHPHHGVHVAARIEVGLQLHPYRLTGQHKVVEQPVGHLLVGDRAIPVAVHVQLDRLELHHPRPRLVQQAQGGEIGITGKRTPTGELGQGDGDLIGPTRPGVLEADQLRFRNRPLAVERGPGLRSARHGRALCGLRERRHGWRERAEGAILGRVSRGRSNGYDNP